METVHVCAEPQRTVLFSDKCGRLQGELGGIRVHGNPPLCPWKPTGMWAGVLASFPVNLTQARITKDKGASIEEMPP